MHVLLFDLDETLIVDHAATDEAFYSTTTIVAKSYSVDMTSLISSARAHAVFLLEHSPFKHYCHSIGISAFEVMWCHFEDENSQLDTLRSWAIEFRKKIWTQALFEQNIEDQKLVNDLVDRFFIQRRKYQKTYEDATATLHKLQKKYTFGLVTNGASSLQQQKIRDSGLADLFQSVTVSGELGFGKPDKRIFEHIVADLGVSADQVVMIGDNLTRDVEGALSAGLHAIWINRHGVQHQSRHRAFLEISSLNALPKLLVHLENTKSPIEVSI